MDTDVILTVGLIFGVLSVPAIAGAFTEGRLPRLAMLSVALAVGCVVFAVMQRPGGYTFEEIPGVVLSVFARFL